MNPTLAERCTMICQPDTLWRGLRLALVVGTLLLVINQGDLLWRGEWPSAWKVLLTYCVPFSVSVWTSVSKDLQAQPKKGENDDHCTAQ